MTRHSKNLWHYAGDVLAVVVFLVLFYLLFKCL